MSVILVSNNNGRSIQAAIRTACPGDLILVNDGVYNESVSVRKNNIRIVANGNCVILKGDMPNSYNNAFTLCNVCGVEIKGFCIKNYSDDGIELYESDANRIVENTIENCGDDGIDLYNSSKNLILNNIIKECSDDGIDLNGDSNNNWILNNQVCGCIENGIEIGPNANNNALIANVVEENKKPRRNGLQVGGENTLLLNNCVHDNGNDGINLDLNCDDCCVIKNTIYNNKADGINIDCGDNLYVSQNIISCNCKSGILIDTDFNIVEQNIIDKNKCNGIKTEKGACSNTIYCNQLINNVPYDINDEGNLNTFAFNQCSKSRPNTLCTDCDTDKCPACNPSDRNCGICNENCCESNCSNDCNDNCFNPCSQNYYKRRFGKLKCNSNWE